MAAALMRVGTTASVSSMPPVYMMLYSMESQINPQSPPPRPLICGMYPPPATFVLTFSGFMSRSNCDPVDNGDLISRQSALTTHVKSIVD